MSASLLLFLFSQQASFASNSADAIAIRVMQNPKHLSITEWYHAQNFTGSPQSLIVDGYNAIRDGRTVYASAANTVSTINDGKLHAGDTLYTNAYIISYNNNAESTTEDIFGQILAHWKFNTNLTRAGNCANTASTTCSSSSDCEANSYCVGSKAIVIRDVKRLADLNDLNLALSNYKLAHNGLCPTMQTGSYIPNKTISTWPSWQGTLGSALGLTLPQDPINKLGDCSQKSEKTGNNTASTVGASVSNVGSTTWAYSVSSWTYDINITTPTNYNAFIETTNYSHVNPLYGDYSKFSPQEIIGVPNSGPESTCPAVGVQHHIKIYVDGVYKGFVCNDAVPASQTHQTGTVPAGLLSAGVHTIKYEWDNDWTYNPDQIWGGVSHDDADSNLVIYKVGFESTNFNPTTCWSEVDKKFADPTPLDANFNLPINSLAYLYISAPDGRSCSFFAPTESGLVCGNDGSCTVNNNVADPVSFGTDPGTLSTSNRPPDITGTNFPAGVNNWSYEGFISALDPDGDKLTWNLSLIGDWGSWAAPALKTSGVANQMKLVSSKAGNIGEYNFTIAVTDTKGSSTSGSYKIKVVNRCDDKDGDGYGVCPNCGKVKGCVKDGNDCDDTIGLHIVNGTNGPVSIDGNKISPGQPDDCTQFDGLDNNCNGQTDEHASVSTVIGTQVQDMETVNSLSGYPAGWWTAYQAKSNIQISDTENHSSNGSKSMLVHQDSNMYFGSACSKISCEDPNLKANTGCMWDDANQKCYFPNADGCHDSTVKGNFAGSDYRASYNNGEGICWGNNNYVMWASLYYDLSTFPFNLDDTYILQYYYKGKVNFNGAINSSLSYDPGWPGMCYGQAALVNNPCISYSPWSDYAPGNPANCKDYNLGGVINWPLANQCSCLVLAKPLANQTGCYSSIYMPGIADGMNSDWTLYSYSFKYDNLLDSIRDSNGNRRTIFGVSVGYNDTGAGSDLYVDDLSLLKCYNQ